MAYYTEVPVQSARVIMNRQVSLVYKPRRCWLFLTRTVVQSTSSYQLAATVVQVHTRRVVQSHTDCVHVLMLRLQEFDLLQIFSARCNIYISRLCYDVSVRLSICDGSELAHYSYFRFQIPIQIYRALSSRGGVISTTTSRAMLATARPSCFVQRYDVIINNGPNC